MLQLPVADAGAASQGGVNVVLFNEQVGGFVNDVPLVKKHQTHAAAHVRGCVCIECCDAVAATTAAALIS